MTGKRLAILILGSIGGLFVLVGLGLLLQGRSQVQEIERVGASQIVRTLAQLSQIPPGGAAMLQGTISERNSLFEQDFAAYVRHQYQGEHCVTPTATRDNYRGATTCQPIWTEDKRETPRLWLDLSEGRVQLANTDYRLQNPTNAWQSTSSLIENRTVLYEGFKIGAPVFTQGSVVMDGETPALRAEFIFGGDSQTYLDTQRSSSNVLFLLGSIFMAVGALALGVMGVVVWVGRK